MVNANINYFEYFQITPAIQLDLNDLRKRYYEKSKSIHPDFNTGDSDNKIVQTAFNNLAYRTLTSPLSRLKYIIETFHGPLNENASLLSQEFLLEMMELHEQTNEALSENDADQINNCQLALANYEDRAMKSALQYINQFDSGMRSAEIFTELSRYYFKMKYFDRLRQSLEGRTTEL